MKDFFIKFKKNLINVAIMGIIFVALFFLGFFMVNLDNKIIPKVAITWPQKAAIEAPISSIDLNAEFKRKIGSTEIAMLDGSTLSYADWAKANGLNSSNNGLDYDPSGSGLPNYLKYIYLTNPKNADPNKKGYTDKQDVDAGFDPTAAKGIRPQIEVSISKIGAVAPMVWSKNDNDQQMLKDLENGVAHFIGTAAPGRKGNAIISGHSSNYVWAKGSYNHIFKDLEKLEKGDVVNIRMTEANGRIIIFHYAVVDKFNTTPDDERIFADTPDSTLTLTTCWPVGTALKRTIVKTEMVK